VFLTDSAPVSPELEPPVRLRAAGKLINAAEIGHAAPFVCDFDGDGLKDLLVSQLKEGLLWVYCNEGTNSESEPRSGCYGHCKE
jgi:hypothetical protein